MRQLIVVAVAMLVACSGLVIKKDDTPAAKTTKVATRTALAVTTFGASEGRIGRARNAYWAEEERKENRADWEAAVADTDDLVTMTQRFHNRAPACTTYSQESGRQMCVWTTGEKREEALPASGNSLAVAPGMIVSASCIVEPEKGAIQADSCSVSFE